MECKMHDHILNNHLLFPHNPYNSYIISVLCGLAERLLGVRKTAGQTLQLRRLNSAVHFSGDERKRLKGDIWGVGGPFRRGANNTCRGGGRLSILLKIRRREYNACVCGGVHFGARPYEDAMTCEPRTQRHLLNISVGYNSPFGWQLLAASQDGGKGSE